MQVNHCDITDGHGTFTLPNLQVLEKKYLYFTIHKEEETTRLW